jgi:hypothetical protein
MWDDGFSALPVSSSAYFACGLIPPAREAFPEERFKESNSDGEAQQLDHIAAHDLAKILVRQAVKLIGP